MSSPTVLIIGAGPTGLTLALELALQHIPLRIIDKAPVRSDKSRALVLHPRSLELLRRHGLTSALRAASTEGVGGSVYVNGTKAFDLDLTDLGMDNTAFPYPLWLSQADTEGVLAKELEKRYGIRVERGVEATAVIQGDDGVSVTLARTGMSEPETLRVAYVVGADGAHSVVRHAAGLTFEGGAYPSDFLLCDAELSWLAPSPPPTASHHKPFTPPTNTLNVFLRGPKLLALFPMPNNTVRLIAAQDPAGRPATEQPTLADFQALLDAVAPAQGELRNPVWLARFRLHHRAAACFRAGRLFVAGDAAHIHSPAGGQGMNTGIQDAVNLGWKLAAVLRAPAAAAAAAADGADQTAPDGTRRSSISSSPSSSLLASYSAERHPVGAKLLRGTDRLFGYGAATGAWWVWWRDLVLRWVVPYLVASRARRARLFGFVSQLGIRYRRSGIVGAAAGGVGGGAAAVRGGDRAPDGRVVPVVRDAGEEGAEVWLLEMARGDRHVLLLFAGLGKPDTTAKGAVAAADELEAAAKTLAAYLEKATSIPGLSDIDIITVFSSHEAAKGASEAVVDVDGRLHAAYGLSGPSYVLVRPDTYIAHLGPLAALGGLGEWLKEHHS